jgi:hypothetical protein
MSDSGETDSRCDICLRNREDVLLVDVAQPNEFAGIGGVKRLWVCSDCAANMEALSDLGRSPDGG